MNTNAKILNKYFYISEEIKTLHNVTTSIFPRNKRVAQHKKINQCNTPYLQKGGKVMYISTDTEKAFDKYPIVLHDLNTQRTKNEGKFLNMI